MGRAQAEGLYSVCRRVRGLGAAGGLPHEGTAGCRVWGSESGCGGVLGLVWQPE